MQHIAEMGKRSLGKILSGTRTVEPLFLKKPEAPFNSVKENDTIFLKSVDGFAVAKATVKKVENYEDLEPERAMDILNKYKDNIKPDELMITKDIYCPYATLLWLDNVQEISPFRVIVPPDSENPRWIRVEDVRALRGA